MAIVRVSRQNIDENNQIVWVEQEIDESEMLPNEFPLRSLVYPT